MNYLLDTHILLWAVQDHPKSSQQARDVILNPSNALFFSSASIWEVAIKFSNFKKLIEPTLLYHLLKKAGYQELLISSLHSIEVKNLPLIHKDPFDRLLIAQARIEQLTLMTADKK